MTIDIPTRSLKLTEAKGPRTAKKDLLYFETHPQAQALHKMNELFDPKFMTKSAKEKKITTGYGYFQKTER